jgi:hypothetical protein
MIHCCFPSASQRFACIVTMHSLTSFVCSFPLSIIHCLSPPFEITSEESGIERDSIKSCNQKTPREVWQALVSSVAFAEEFSQEREEYLRDEFDLNTLSRPCLYILECIAMQKVQPIESCSLFYHLVSLDFRDFIKNPEALKMLWACQRIWKHKGSDPFWTCLKEFVVGTGARSSITNLTD